MHNKNIYLSPRRDTGKKKVLFGQGNIRHNSDILIYHIQCVLTLHVVLALISLKKVFHILDRRNFLMVHDQFPYVSANQFFLRKFYHILSSQA